jgi:hypothetical protein
VLFHSATEHLSARITASHTCHPEKTRKTVFPTPNFIISTFAKLFADSAVIVLHTILPVI